MTPNASDDPGLPAGAAGPRHAQARRAVAVAVGLLPLVLAATVLVVQNHQLERERVQQAALSVARSLSAQVDGELKRIEAGLWILATSPLLQTDDLASFHQRASEAAKLQAINNYLLTDRDGRQTLNTLVPFGQPLPTKGTPAALRAVFSEDRAALTDLFIGPVTGTHVFAMGVPVRRQGQVVYSLNIGMSSDRMATVMDQHYVPEGWIVAVLDGSGTIVARNREAQSFVGQPAVKPLLDRVARDREGVLETPTKEGIPVLLAYSQSAASRWTVAVGVPSADRSRQSLRSLAGQIALVLLGWVASTAWVMKQRPA